MNETHELADVMVSTDYDKKIAADVTRRRGFFINDFLEEQKTKLGNEEFMKQKAKLEEEAGKRFDLAHEGKLRFYELEEQSITQLTNWAPLEKALKQWLENEGYASELVKKSIENRKADFETCQAQIKQKMAAANYDADADFRLKVLNPKTRDEAFKAFLFDTKHFELEALKLLFELFDKRR